MRLVELNGGARMNKIQMPYCDYLLIFFRKKNSANNEKETETSGDTRQRNGQPSYLFFPSQDLHGL